jgi:branched-subunit amino acid aminotransferase/4-amino-4-deoxychorismate lyase
VDESATTARTPLNVLAVAVAGRGLIDRNEPVFSASDEALLRGRAVFETARVYPGRRVPLDPHLERLTASAGRLRLPRPDATECERLAQLVIEHAGEPELVLRLYWTGETLVATAAAIPPNLEQLRRRGLRLATIPWMSGSLAAAKTISYAENVRAQDNASERGANDALLVAGDGTVLEAPTANLWWRQGSRLLTPSLGLPILAGVTRATLISIAPNVGYEVEETSAPIKQLLAADEVFLSSSIREVMPVTRIDGLRIGDGLPGPAANALQAALRAHLVGTSPSFNAAPATE